MASTRRKPIQIIFDAVDRITKKTRKIERSLRSVANASKKMGTVLFASFSIPAMMIGGSMFRVAVETSAAMNQVRANVELGATSFDKLRESVVKYSSTSVKNPGEILEGITAMGRAGWNTDKILEGYQGITEMSIALRSNTEDVANLMAKTSNVFGIEDKDLQRAYDVSTSIISGTPQNMEDFSYAMGHGAAPATILGMSHEQTAQIIGGLAEAGVLGTRAGTALTGLAKAVANNEKIGNQFGDEAQSLLASGDIQGMVLNIAKQMKTLNVEDRATKIQESFGSVGMRGIGALIMKASTNEDTFEKLISLTQSSEGVTKRMAGEQLQGLSGLVLTIKASFETLSVKVMDSLNSVLMKIGGLIVKLNNFLMGLPNELLVVLVGLTTALVALGPILLLTSQLLSAVPGLVSVMSGLTTFFSSAAFTTAISGGIKGVISTMGAKLTTLIPASVGTAIGSISAVTWGWIVVAIGAIIAVVSQIKKAVIFANNLKTLLGVAFEGVIKFFDEIDSFTKDWGLDGEFKQLIKELWMLIKPVAMLLAANWVLQLYVLGSVLKLVIKAFLGLINLLAKLQRNTVIGRIAQKFGDVDRDSQFAAETENRVTFGSMFYKEFDEDSMRKLLNGTQSNEAPVQGPQPQTINVQLSDELYSPEAGSSGQIVFGPEAGAL